MPDSVIFPKSYGRIIKEKESFSRRTGFQRAGWWAIHLLYVAF
jgi:hypothetical protein